MQCHICHPALYNSGLNISGSYLWLVFIHIFIMAINVNNHVVIKYLKMSEPAISFNTFSMSYLNRIIAGCWKASAKYQPYV